MTEEQISMLLELLKDDISVNIINVIESFIAGGTTEHTPLNDNLYNAIIISAGNSELLQAFLVSLSG